MTSFKFSRQLCNDIIASAFMILLVVIPINAYSQSDVTRSNNSDFNNLNIDTKLIADPRMLPGNGFFVLPDNANINFTGKSKICPSGDCTGIIEEPNSLSFRRIRLDSMQLQGDFRLVDNSSNSKFTPLKKALVEKIHIYTTCDIGDIVENQQTNSTKYLCKKDSDFFSLSRSFNDTNYKYQDVNMTFEEPSLRFTLTGAEN